MGLQSVGHHLSDTTTTTTCCSCPLHRGCTNRLCKQGRFSYSTLTANCLCKTVCFTQNPFFRHWELGECDPSKQVTRPLGTSVSTLRHGRGCWAPPPLPTSQSLCEWMGITTGREGDWTGEGKQAPGQKETARLLLFHGTVSDHGMNGSDQAPIETGRPCPRCTDPCFKAQAAYQDP